MIERHRHAMLTPAGNLEVGTQLPGEPLFLVLADGQQAEWPDQLAEMVGCRGDDEDPAGRVEDAA